MCYGWCLHGDQMFTYIDNDPEQEQCYQYCNKQHYSPDWNFDCSTCKDFEPIPEYNGDKISEEGNLL